MIILGTHIYFLGIGGIGMSALASYFLSKGSRVYGYDRFRSEVCMRLESEGAHIVYDDDITSLPSTIDSIIMTPAIPKTLGIYQHLLSSGQPIYKRSEVLGALTKDLYNIAIAGTHGKTTITTMVAYLLRQSSVGCTAFLGGIASNYNTNFWQTNPELAVLEADEYDRSFLQLQPNEAVITAVDADHLEIYGTVESMWDAYASFANLLKPDGKLYIKHGLKIDGVLLPHASYSLQNNSAHFYASDIVQKDGGYVFNWHGNGQTLSQLRLNLGGMHNVENAVVAIAIALNNGVTPYEVEQALPMFKGVKRRFEYVVKSEKHVYIDDYAHHPEELKTLVQSVKRLFPKEKCIVAFQPHLYTRTQNLASEFAEALSYADEVLLLDIYPARELPIKGVSSALIADKVTVPCTILSKDSLLTYVDLAQPKLFVTAGAGDIDQLIETIKNSLK